MYLMTRPDRSYKESEPTAGWYARWTGRRLANYALRKAEKGMIDTTMTAKTRLIFGQKAYVHDTPQVYDLANKRLAQHDLRVVKVGEFIVHSTDTSWDHDLMEIQRTSVVNDVTAQAEPAPSDTAEHLSTC